ncbi:MAG TPA: hypothetical protein DGH68_07845 [Bacteroidetes bacterium]|nr:hypothetical protein [Bacteroidota bacterium]
MSDNFPIGGLYDYVKKVANLWADPSLKLKYDTTVGGEKVEEKILQCFTLYQNYPNPFNPTTSITYSLPKHAHVDLKVYDLLGQEAATLVNREVLAGTHSVGWDASGAPSGVYFYRITVSGNSITNKMLLLK